MSCVLLILASGFGPCRIMLLELFTHGGVRMEMTKVRVVLMSQVKRLRNPSVFRCSVDLFLPPC